MSYYQGFPENKGSVGGGFGLGVVLNVLQGIILWICLFFGTGDTRIRTLIIGLGGWGLIQLLYMVPIFIYLRRSKRSDTAKGLLIATSLVLLVNASCWGYIQFHG